MIRFAIFPTVNVNFVKSATIQFKWSSTCCEETIYFLCVGQRNVLVLIQHQKFYFPYPVFELRYKYQDLRSIIFRGVWF